MNTIDDDIRWLQTQLTAANWHLDAALAAPIEMARRNIDRARQAYYAAKEALRDLGPPGDHYQTIVEELARLRERLQSAGAEV